MKSSINTSGAISLKNGATLILAAQFPHTGDWYLHNIMAKFNGQWVTWVYNETDKDCHFGHYFDNQYDGMVDFSKRVEKVNTNFDLVAKEDLQQEQEFLAAMQSVYPKVAS
jgi:hypothetical protein